MSIDLTQWIGMAAFATAAIACLRPARARPIAWRLLAAGQLVCCAEVALGARYLLHNAVDLALQANGRYDARQPVQWALVAAVLLLLLACATAVIGHARRLGAGLTGALVGTLLATTVFGTETISLHEIDALMYAMVGPIKVIGWLWVGVSAITTAAALRGAGEAARRR